MTTRLALLRPPGCCVSLPFLSYALPVMALDRVNLVVGALLTSLLSSMEREALSAGSLRHVVSHYDLRTPELIRECLACGASSILPIPGDLDERWRPTGVPDGFPGEYLRRMTDFRDAHCDCDRGT